jgi:oxygen-independent coproporphyrinogen-3 oxidase
MRGVRWRNVASTEDYVTRVAEGRSLVAERRLLTNDERLGDALFTGLRLTRGIDLDALSARYGVDVWRQFGERLAPFLDAGILLRRESTLRLTRSGMLVANEVMSVFV